LGLVLVPDDARQWRKLMRILYLVTDFDLIGGKEWYDRSAIRMLQELGEHVRVVKLAGTSLSNKILFILKSFVETLVKRPDMVFCAHISFSPIAYFLKWFFGIPYIIFTYGTEVWDIKNDFYRKALQNTQLVLTISRYTALKLRGQIPTLESKIFFLKPVADSTRFSIKEKPQYLVQRHGLADAKILLTVAHLYPTEESKGYLRVIDALPLVRDVFPKVRYVIVGAGMKGFGDNRERIRAYAKERGISERVILAGRVPDEEIADYYNLCDLFVMPSSQEGFGVVFLESLVSGRPVIAGNRDGSRDAVLDGELGILVDPDDTDSTARAIIEMLKGRAPRRFYDREFLRRRVLEIYGYEKFKEKVAELLKIINRGL